MPAPSPSSPPPPDELSESLSGHINANILSIVAFHEREYEKVGASQRRLEILSGLIGRPAYLITLVSLLCVWICANGLAALLGFRALDPPPFVWLQAVVTLAALLTTTVVLFAQNRQVKLESQRAHLDLQVNLLTEQKVTKLIRLLEELRRDLPMVRDRHDPEALAMQQPTDTAKVLSALEDRGVGSVGSVGSDGKPALAASPESAVSPGCVGALSATSPRTTVRPQARHTRSK
jgi:uncharacterized membrane protein